MVLQIKIPFVVVLTDWDKKRVLTPVVLLSRHGFQPRGPLGFHTREVTVQMLILARHLSLKLSSEAQAFARFSRARLSAVFCAFLEVVKILLARFWLQTTYFHLALTFAVRSSSLPLTSLFLHLYSVEKHLLMDFWLAVLVNASRFCFAVLHLIRDCTFSCVFEELAHWAIEQI